MSQKGQTLETGAGSLGENWVYITAVIIWPHHGPVAGNERVSSWKIPDARLHTTETETETEVLRFSPPTTCTPGKQAAPYTSQWEPPQRDHQQEQKEEEERGKERETSPATSSVHVSTLT